MILNWQIWGFNKLFNGNIIQRVTGGDLYNEIYKDIL